MSNSTLDTQRKLAQLGLYRGRIDGISGNLTRAALSDFAELSDSNTVNLLDNLQKRVNGLIFEEATSRWELAHYVRAMCEQMYRPELVYPAYIMATVQHETANTFLPIQEGDFLKPKQRAEDFRAGLWYAPYWGRGYCQLTHEHNYLKYSDITGVDFVNHPDRVMEPSYALFILVHGMITGTFTGKSMNQFVLGDKVDVINMRRVVNGVRRGEILPDKAELIQTYYDKWFAWYNR